MTTSSSITAIVNTFNSADVLKDCLNSLSWVDEVIVVDSGSTDGTCEIAVAFGVRLLYHNYDGPVAQKLWAFQQARSEWILSIDSDERVPNELRNEIKEILQVGTCHAGFRVPRLNYVFGKPIRFANYFPDWQSRLFRRDKWYINASTQIHEHVEFWGTYGVLQHPIHHLAHRSVDQTNATLLIRWTTFEASQRYSRGIRFSIWQMLARTVGAFGLRYFIQQGYRDGLRGFFVSSYWAIYLFIVYLKLWELENAEVKIKTARN